MAICSYCGERFNVESTRRYIDRKFGEDTYDDAFPNNDVCGDCARDEISSDIESGNDTLRLNGDWYND